MLDFHKLSADYQQALLRQVVPFWLKHGRDGLCGGYYDRLSATGEVIEGNKSVALQAQQVWAFAWLYNRFDGQPGWLDHARHGGEFLSQFAHQDDLSCYDQLDRRGRPVALATDALPDAWAVSAYAQLHRATGNDEWAMLATQTFATLLQRRNRIRAEQAQAVGGFQQRQCLNEPAALLQTILAMQPLLDEERYKEAVDTVLQELLYEFLDRRTETLREFILPEGAFMNTPEGRRLNVGLTFQTIVVLLDLCTESGNRKLAMQVVTWALRLCEQAWDDIAGGLNQYVDFKNQPLVFADWQQKWAWVQVEGITALIKGYFQTRHPDCPKWFKRIHEYTFTCFPDARQPGWHLVVDAHRQPLVTAKAMPPVSCASLIHSLAETAQTLTRCGQLQPMGRHVRVV